MEPPVVAGIVREKGERQKEKGKSGWARWR
jgi:hypothetical protein